MKERLDYYKASPDATKALIALEVATGKLGLEPALLELVRMRASQINGCAFCVDLHASDMRKKGESERRIQTVAVWREAPFFTRRERAALAWTESVTQIATHRASDADYEALAAEFSEVERVNLTLAISVINSWNRLSIAFRKPLSA